MKRLVASLLTLAMFSCPLFAANKSSIKLSETLTVGSTQIRSGEYKLAYDGEGPIVKVTLTRDNGSKVMLDAKLVAGSHEQKAVMYSSETVNGFHVLKQIDLSKVSLVFDTQQNTN